MRDESGIPGPVTRSGSPALPTFPHLRTVQCTICPGSAMRKRGYVAEWGRPGQLHAPSTRPARAQHAPGQAPRCCPRHGTGARMVGMEHQNLLGGPAPTYLPEDPAAAELEYGVSPADVAAAHPACLEAWAALSDEAMGRGETVTSYAFARTGYHRGLDQLRRAGWRGQGPIPWEHIPNRGFLRSLHALGRAAAALGEQEEAERCLTFLQDASPLAAAELNGG